MAWKLKSPQKKIAEQVKNVVFFNFFCPSRHVMVWNNYFYFGLVFIKKIIKSVFFLKIKISLNRLVSVQLF
jgi:hypothetical protein